MTGRGTERPPLQFSAGRAAYGGPPKPAAGGGEDEGGDGNGGGGEGGSAAQGDALRALAGGAAPAPIRRYHDGSHKAYMVGKVAKLHEQGDSARALAVLAVNESSDALSGVGVFVNGGTSPPKAELSDLVLAHGGTVENYQTPRVTHIVADQLPVAKLRDLGWARGKPVVRAKWVLDSIRAKTRLPVGEYLLMAHAYGDPRQGRLRGMMPSQPQPQPEPRPQPREQGGAGSPRGPRSPARPLDPAQEFAARAREEAGRRWRLSGPPLSSRDNPRHCIDYWQCSRLNFLGRWRSRIDKLIDALPSSQPQHHLHQKQPAGGLGAAADTYAFAERPERVIIHVDMDCFFASVSTRGVPELEGRAVAVSHSANETGRGEVSAANYAARAKGVRANMRMCDAVELCPDLVVMPYDFDAYTEASEAVYRVILSIVGANRVKPHSCDEAYLDATGLGDPLVLAGRIRTAIREATGLPASCGCGPNTLMAMLATRKAKPDGAAYITQAEAEAHIQSLPAKDLPGVGWRTARKLDELGVRTCADVKRLSRTKLAAVLGAQLGADLYKYCRGIDDRPFELSKERKSVQAECNYGIRLDNVPMAEHFVRQCAEEACNRLREAKRLARGITLKLMKRKANAKEPYKFMGHGPCDDFSRSFTLHEATGATEVVCRTAVSLFHQLKISPEDVRGMGVQLTKLLRPSEVVGTKTLESLFGDAAGSTRGVATAEGGALAVGGDFMPSRSSAADKRRKDRRRSVRFDSVVSVEGADDTRLTAAREGGAGGDAKEGDGSSGDDGDDRSDFDLGSSARAALARTKRTPEPEAGRDAAGASEFTASQLSALRPFAGEGATDDVLVAALRSANGNRELAINAILDGAHGSVSGTRAGGEAATLERRGVPDPSPSPSPSPGRRKRQVTLTQLNISPSRGKRRLLGVDVEGVDGAPQQPRRQQQHVQWPPPARGRSARGRAEEAAREEADALAQMVAVVGESVPRDDLWRYLRRAGGKVDAAICAALDDQHARANRLQPRPTLAAEAVSRARPAEGGGGADTLFGWEDAPEFGDGDDACDAAGGCDPVRARRDAGGDGSGAASAGGASDEHVIQIDDLEALEALLSDVIAPVLEGVRASGSEAEAEEATAEACKALSSAVRACVDMRLDVAVRAVRRVRAVAGRVHGLADVAERVEMELRAAVAASYGQGSTLDAP